VARPAPRRGDRSAECLCRSSLAEVPHDGETNQRLLLRSNPPEARESLLIGKWRSLPDCNHAVGDWRSAAQAVAEERLWHAKITHTASANGQAFRRRAL
jgi:hypothetical protein